MWVAYIKAQLRIATKMSVIKVKVTFTKIEIQSLHSNLSLLRSIDTKFSMWIAFIKTHFGIATQVYVNKVKVTVF